MRVTYLALFAVFGLTSTLFALEVDGTESGVTIYQDEFRDDRKESAGRRYYVENSNDYPVWFSVELTERRNVLNGLVDERIYVHPHQTCFIGIVTPRNPRQRFRWRYRWEITRAVSGPPALILPSREVLHKQALEQIKNPDQSPVEQASGQGGKKGV